jgi:ADP-ribose pyrophosphatase YjhB (NUDIX family)
MNYNFPRPNYQRPDTNIPGQTPPRDMYAKRNVRGAGALIMAKMTGRLLFALRASGKNKPQEWNLWGGKVAVDESPEQSVIGWTKKQTGYKGQFSDVIPIYSFVNAFTNFRYYNFLITVDDEFTPRPSKDYHWESNGFRWVKYGQWPTPLHFGLQILIQYSGSKIRKIIDNNFKGEKLF